MFPVESRLLMESSNLYSQRIVKQIYIYRVSWISSYIVSSLVADVSVKLHYIIEIESEKKFNPLLNMKI